jgi:hypothetical protein
VSGSEGVEIDARLDVAAPESQEACGRRQSVSARPPLLG